MAFIMEGKIMAAAIILDHDKRAICYFDFEIYI